MALAEDLVQLHCATQRNRLFITVMYPLIRAVKQGDVSQVLLFIKNSSAEVMGMINPRR